MQVKKKILLSLILLMFTVPAIGAGLPAGTTFQILANATFFDSIENSSTAPVSATLTVAQSAAITIQAGTAPQSTSPGMIYYIPMQVINNGNGADTFKLSISSNQGWSTSIIRDDNSDGIRQATEVTQVTSTGLLAAGAGFSCFASITVPSGATAGSTVTTAASSMFDLSSSASAAFVMPAPSSHNVIFTQMPTVSPTTVAPTGTVQCSTSAADSLGHTVTYAWSDGGAGGTFSPSASSQNPTYKAPSNAGSTITLACIAACSQDVQTSKSAQATLTLSSASAPKVTGIIPVNGETNISLKMEIVVTFDQAMDRQAVQSAITTSPALSQPVYNWTSDSTQVSITHADLNPATTYSVTVGTSAKSAAGSSLANAYSWSFKTISTASTAQFEPNQVTVPAATQFTTPAITLNDPSNPTTASLTVGIPAGFGIDTTSVNGSLACVQKGADTGTFKSTWDAASRQIAISANMATPGSNVEVVKGIVLTSPQTQGPQQLTVNGNPSLTVSVSGAAPGDFNSSGQVDSTDLSLFNSEWTRIHRLKPPFSSTTDGAYDLAPRSSGAWPMWTPIGDKRIDINDATAFIESWMHSQNSTMSYSGNVTTSVSRTSIAVTVTSAPYGMFQANIQLPSTARFNTTLNSQTGNLVYVVPQRGAGSLFYSEYDAVNRIVRITGIIKGTAPYLVAVIYIS